MTTVIGWVGVDQRGPSSVYFAADSRFSESDRSVWDYGRKAFASRTTPEILAYCGDVIFASTALGQALQLLEGGLLWQESASPEDRTKSLDAFLKESWQKYPRSRQTQFSVTYACRLRSGMDSLFFMAKLGWDQSLGWTIDLPPLPIASDIVVVAGSGEPHFREKYRRWSETEISGTSRAVYSAFCDHVKSGRDPRTGGAPQLVGLFREGNAVTFGIIYHEERWASGIRVSPSPALNKVTWVNELFEQRDGITMNLADGAQRHARPRSI
jgi:hypothetical protein